MSSAVISSMTWIAPDRTRNPSPLICPLSYSLVYAIDADTLVVIAVAHQQREPRYWANRLDSI
jgi:hypothetical protein